MSPNGADIVMLLLSCGARADARDTVEKVRRSLFNTLFLGTNLTQVNDTVEKTAEAYGQKHPDVRTAFR